MAVYIELVESIPGCALRTSRSAVNEAHATQTVAPIAIADARAWLLRGKLRKPVRDYLRIALDCIDPIIDENLSGAALGSRLSPSSAAATQPESSLLLRYRAAICKLDAIPELEAVRAGEPRFVEVSLFIARAEFARLPFEGPRPRTKVHLDELLARFPASTAVTYLAATYHQLVGSYAEAAADDDFPGARALLDLAAGDPALANHVAELGGWLDRNGHGHRPR